MIWTQAHWLYFTVGVIILLMLDLFVFHRKDSESSFGSSAAWTVFWCFLALCFNGYIYSVAGSKAATEFLTGYLVEWSLSVDNVFVFAVVFNYFRIPLQNQHRVLFWGILGAIIMRFLFITLGLELLRHFEWIMTIFGALLIFTGIKMLKHDNDQVNPEDNFVMRIGKKFLRVHPVPSNDVFFIKENGKWYVTSLFLVLLVLESTDVLFAVDSVPAIFGITRDPYIVFTSNIAAILGLRSLYFLLAGIVQYFRYLNYGLCGILVFVGVKMNVEYWFRPEDGHHLIPPFVSLAVIVAILSISIAASVMVKKTAD
jgi:tellurite resistance protein TerC